jgi:hypothetical protein
MKERQEHTYDHHVRPSPSTWEEESGIYEYMSACLNRLCVCPYAEELGMVVVPGHESNQHEVR